MKDIPNGRSYNFDTLSSDSLEFDVAYQLSSPLSFGVPVIEVKDMKTYYDL